MKILQVISYFTEKRGGDVNICYNLSKELIELGHDVTIITTDFEFNPSYAQSLKKAKIIPFKRVVNLGLFIYTPEMAQWLKMNISDYDVVHLHNVRSYQNNLVLKYARDNNIPYILQPHGTILRIVEKENFKKLYDFVWGNRIIQYASKIVAVSKNEVEQFKKIKIPDSKIIVIPNGIKDITLQILPPFGKFKKRYNIHEKKIILYVGRIHRRKGIDVLINAFNSFINTWSKDDVILIIVGPDDGYRTSLEELVKKLDLTNKVKFIGFIPSLTDAYIDANLLVYPAIHEIFGLVPFEALIYGTPVIVADDSGCGDLIKGAACGYLVHYGDVAGLAEMIRYALEHPEKNEKMVIAGRHYIKENLAWEKIGRQVEKMYENCALKSNISGTDNIKNLD